MNAEKEIKDKLLKLFEDAEREKLAREIATMKWEERI